MRRRISPFTAWNRFWFAPGPAVRLGLARAIFCGSAFFFYLPHDFTEWGTAAPVFWMPIWLFETFHIPALPSDVLAVLQAVWKASLAMCALGLWTRMSAVVAALLGTYLLGLPHNFGATQHFDTLVVFAFCILAVSRAGDARSLDSLLHPSRRRATPRFGAEYTWPIRAMWVLTALIFFGAGTSKLRHSGIEWVWSDNLQLLLMRAYYHVSDGDPLTSLGLVIAQHPLAARVFAATSLAIETLYFVALFSRRARPFIGVAGIAMLVGIRVLMGPTFEPFLICALFCVPWHRVEALIARLFISPSPISEIVEARLDPPSAPPPRPSIAFRSLL
ncbi:MAG TPA: hypothetical protein VGQ16_05820 [Vicinamibacterales bacterium]|jgi:hypothetical protein|nr:hypothetical protein [Vicinamibacterales bacterium]